MVNDYPYLGSSTLDPNENPVENPLQIFLSHTETKINSQSSIINIPEQSAKSFIYNP